MLDVINELDKWAENGEEIAISTVVSTWGSAPRPVGSKMVTTRSGLIAGSVSGGCVEGAVIEASEEIFTSGQPKLLTFGVADEQAWEVGLACGGTIQVFLEPFSALKSVYPSLRSHLNGRKPITLTSLLKGDTDLINKKLLVLGDGSTQGDLHIPEGQDTLLQVSLSHLRKGESGNYQLEDGTLLFFETIPPTPRLIIIGAVHITQSLVPMANAAGFETVVIDPRGVFATSERFHDANQLIKEWPQKTLPELDLDRHDYIVVLSHDPKLDDPALQVSLNSNARYIGALGSRRTHKDRLNRLRDLGLSDEQLARIHAPIGLPLGGGSTGEVAVSIMAEILLSKNNVEYHISNTSS